MPLLRCQSMLSNSMQCGNDAWGHVGDIAYCRLHFSYLLAQTTDLEDFKPTIINPADSPDLENMLKQRIEAQKATEAATEEAKLQQ